jgi:phosphoglycerol transferase MdoB-like AlkP superfamily enzyme
MVRYLYQLFAPHAFSVLVYAALICTLAVKFYHSLRYEAIGEYVHWILTDLAVLLGVEVFLATVCYRWPRRWLVRLATILAALICTWSVINAGWIIRTGTQILPATLLPLLRDPLNALVIVGINLAKSPISAFILLGPSALALIFFIMVIARPVEPRFSRRFYRGRVYTVLFVLVLVLPVRGAGAHRQSSSQPAAGLYYNSQLKAITSIILPDANPLDREDFLMAKRLVPKFDEVLLEYGNPPLTLNVVVVVLEGIQYSYTSLSGRKGDLTPFLKTLADGGIEFSNTRSTVTHTTKALFALLTGRYPSASQDVVEAVPGRKPFATLATILEQQRDMRTAFFQSAKGNFESRAGLVRNLGFQSFWARDDLNDPNTYLGYLASDEFSMIRPIRQWIAADKRPFFLTVLCSATHDPYEVPLWYDTPAKEPIDRYKQTIRYTDSFLYALDVEFANLGLPLNTIFCVIGDHGEAFGEHGKLGHERIGFDEVLHIPWIIRAPCIMEPAARITLPVSSIDLTPTILGLMGFATDQAFDGLDAMRALPDHRKIFFSGWAPEGPAGYILDNQKYIYNPSVDSVEAYDLRHDPLELTGLDVEDTQKQVVIHYIQKWRKDSLIKPDQEEKGKVTLFDRWICRWAGRDPVAKYHIP